MSREHEPSAARGGARGRNPLLHLRRIRAPRPGRRALFSLLLLGLGGALLGGLIGARGDGQALLAEVRAGIADEHDARRILRATLLASPADYRAQGGQSGSDGSASITSVRFGEASATEIFGAGWSRHLWSTPGSPLLVGRADASGVIDWRRFERADWSGLKGGRFGLFAVAAPGGLDPLALGRRLLGASCLDALRLPDQGANLAIGLVLCDEGLLRELTGDAGAGLALRLYLDRATLETRAAEIEIRYPDGDWSAMRLDFGAAGAIPTPQVPAARAQDDLATWLAH